jgi:hypothetical protein
MQVLCNIPTSDGARKIFKMGTILFKRKFHVMLLLHVSFLNPFFDLIVCFFGKHYILRFFAQHDYK